MRQGFAIVVLVVCMQFPVLGAVVWLLARCFDPVHHLVLLDFAFKAALLLGMFVHASLADTDEEEEWE